MRRLQIVLTVHWIGGAHGEMRLPKRRRGQRNSTSADIVLAVRQLVLIAKDDRSPASPVETVCKPATDIAGRASASPLQYDRTLVSPCSRPPRMGSEAMAQPQQCRQDPESRAKDTAARSRGRSDRSHHTPCWRAPGSLPELPSQHPPRNSSQSERAEPKIPHRIATRTTKPLLFGHIDRWVFWCAVAQKSRYRPIEARASSRFCRPSRHRVVEATLPAHCGD